VRVYCLCHAYYTNHNETYCVREREWTRMHDLTLQHKCNYEGVVVGTEKNLILLRFYSFLFQSPTTLRAPSSTLQPLPSSHDSTHHTISQRPIRRRPHWHTTKQHRQPRVCTKSGEHTAILVQLTATNRLAVVDAVSLHMKPTLPDGV
jgi:hypothetical protein